MISFETFFLRMENVRCSSFSYYTSLFYLFTSHLLSVQYWIVNGMQLSPTAETARYFPERKQGPNVVEVKFTVRNDDVFLSGWSDASSDTPTVLPSRGVKVWRPEFRVTTNKPVPPLFAVLVQNGGRVFTWINLVNNKLLTMVPGQDGKDSRSVMFDFVKAGGQKGARGFKAIKRADMCSLVVLEPVRFFRAVSYEADIVCEYRSCLAGSLKSTMHQRISTLLLLYQRIQRTLVVQLHQPQITGRERT
jgi:hypothetical protein